VARVPWRVVAGFWAGFWLLYVVVQWPAYAVAPAGYPAPTPARVLEELVRAALWAALTPAVFWLGARFPLRRGAWGAWGARLALHALGALLAALAYGYAAFAVHNRLAHRPAARHAADLASATAYVLDTQYRFYLFFYLAILAAGFALHFHRDLQRQQRAAARLEAQLLEARLRALRMQLHPHFLFNALNTVAALTERDPAGARRVIARLGDLLRRALESSDAPETTLGEELRFARDYLDVVRARFGDRLQVETSVPPALAGALVPTLILQPLLENAVEHGVAAHRGAGHVAVAAEQVGAHLRLRVTNTGAALPAVVQDGVGLTNTRARLAELYGTAGALRLRGAGTDAGADGGPGAVVAEVDLPYRTAPSVGWPGTGVPNAGPPREEGG
jgi:signal transduction histidine kinase